MRSLCYNCVIVLCAFISMSLDVFSHSPSNFYISASITHPLIGYHTFSITDCRNLSFDDSDWSKYTQYTQCPDHPDIQIRAQTRTCPSSPHRRCVRHLVGWICKRTKQSKRKQNRNTTIQVWCVCMCRIHRHALVLWWVRWCEWCAFRRHFKISSPPITWNRFKSPPLYLHQHIRMIISALLNSCDNDVLPSISSIYHDKIHVFHSKTEQPPRIKRSEEIAFEHCCRYRHKKCTNVRALKRNGDLHTLCELHRQRSNSSQRRTGIMRRLSKPTPSKRDACSTPRSTLSVQSHERASSVVLPSLSSVLHRPLTELLKNRS